MYRSAVATYYVLHIERTSISYNHLNLPAKVSQNGSDLAKYSYLASGSKSKAEDGSGVGLVYRGSLIYRKASDGSLTLEGAGMPEGRLTVNGVRWYVKDHLGSVRAVVDGSTGGLLAVTDYEAYGEDTANATASSYLSAAPAGETFRDHFTGKEDQGPDFGTAYTDFGARQYSPALRRWLVPDPLSEKYYGVSPYAYCAGDPVNMVDLDGMKIVVREINNGTFCEYSWRQVNEVWGFYNAEFELYSGDNTYIKSVSTALLELMDGQNGQSMVSEIVKSNEVVLIGKRDNLENEYFPGSNSISWDPEKSTIGPPYLSLGHELAHALDDLRGTYNNEIWISKQYSDYSLRHDILKAEIFATHYENLIRREHGYPLREAYLMDSNGQFVGPTIIDRKGRSRYYNSRGVTKYKRIIWGNKRYKY